MDKIELLPCPFCNAKAQFREDKLPAGSAHWVECQICDAGTKYGPSQNDVARTWNARADSAKLASAIEVLRHYAHGCDICGSDCEDNDGCGNEAAEWLEENDK